MYSHRATNKIGKQKLYIMGGIALALIAVVILTCCLIGTGSRNRKFNSLYDSASASYAAQDYDAALDDLKQALAVKKLSVSKQADVYLLMADIYAAQGDTEAARSLLEDAYGVLKDARLYTKLQALASDAEEAAQEGIVIGKTPVAADAVSAVLNSMSLTSQDIAPLAAVTTLQTLNLSGNRLDDLSALSGLTALDYLALGDNSISDLSPLSGLSELRTLYLDNNPITDFSPLYELKNLTLLSIKSIEMTQEQIEALCQKLPNCAVYVTEPEVTEITIGGRTVSVEVTELELIDCGITDITDLALCTKLQTLNLQGNSITDVSALSGLTDLKKLILWDNDITNIAPLASLINLTYLDIDANSVQDLSPLTSLTKLTSLWCSGNDLASLEPLAQLPGLTSLGLKNDGLTDSDLEWLKGLTRLGDLRLDGNTELTAKGVDSLQSALPYCTISRPTGLSGSVTLGGTVYYSDATSISCAGMGVTDISGLSGFTSLTSLNLARNSITDISVLSSVTSLTSIDLSYNTGITNLSALSGLSKLSYLSLAGCTGVTNATALYGLSSLWTLDVTGTGLTWEQVDMLRTCLPSCAVYSDAVEPQETVEGDMGAAG